MYPIGIHFLSIQIVAEILSFICYCCPAFGDLQDHLLLMNLLGASLPIPICYWFFQRDEKMRENSPLHRQKLSVSKTILSCLLGAALAIYGNILIGLLPLSQSAASYSNTMNTITKGHTIFLVLLWSSICAPLAEEFVFRWLIYKRLRDTLSAPIAALISAFLFGLYHGNLIQFIYAFLIGLVLALIIEWTGNIWSCVLLHISANFSISVYSLCASFFFSSAFGLFMYCFLMILLFSILWIAPKQLQK